MMTTTTHEPTFTTLEDAYFWWSDFQAAQSQFEDTEDRLELWCAEDDRMAANVLAFRPKTASGFAMQVAVCRIGGEWHPARLEMLLETARPFL